MNDFNFFSSFEKSKKQQKQKTRRTYGAFLAVILIIALFYGVLEVRIHNYSKEIQKGEEFLNAPEVKDKLVEIQGKKEGTASLKTYITQVEQAKQKISITNRITSELLDIIEQTIPVNVSLKDLNIFEYRVDLVGSSPVVTSAAEITHNLEATGLFTRVHVYSINYSVDTAAYDFNIQCDLREVAAK